MVGKHIPTRAERGLIRSNSVGPLNRPERLRNSVRVVIGLDNMGCDTVSQMADILRLFFNPRRQQFLDMAAKVRRSRHPVVTWALQHGLPRACPGFLPQGSFMRCRTCGGKCSAVPCVKCSRPTYSLAGELSSGYELNGQGDVVPDDPDEKDDLPLRRPKSATKSDPGTAEKIEVMRARLERGESCFHKDDPAIIHLPDRGECYGALRVVGAWVEDRDPSSSDDDFLDMLLED